VSGRQRQRIVGRAATAQAGLIAELITARSENVVTGQPVTHRASGVDLPGLRTQDAEAPILAALLGIVERGSGQQIAQLATQHGCPFVGNKQDRPISTASSAAIVELATGQFQRVFNVAGRAGHIAHKGWCEASKSIGERLPIARVRVNQNDTRASCGALPSQERNHPGFTRASHPAYATRVQLIPIARNRLATISNIAENERLVWADLALVEQLGKARDGCNAVLGRGQLQRRWSLIRMTVVVAEALDCVRQPLRALGQCQPLDVCSLNIAVIGVAPPENDQTGGGIADAQTEWRGEDDEAQHIGEQWVQQLQRVPLPGQLGQQTNKRDERQCD